MACNGMSFGNLLEFRDTVLQASVACGQRVTKRQPSGIFIGLGSSPLSWILLCALYINRKTSFLFSTIISFSKYSLRQHHPVIRKLAAADFFKLRQQICNLQILLLFS